MVKKEKCFKCFGSGYYGIRFGSSFAARVFSDWRFGSGILKKVGASLRDKKFLNLDEQVKRLIDKGVCIAEVDAAKVFLRDSNYYNMIACGKVKFATGRFENGEYDYEKSDFSQWQNYFERDCVISKHLMGNISHFERVVNSRLAYYVSELIASGKLDTEKLSALIMVISGRRNPTNYIGERTWEHVTHKTFGELRHIIKWLWQNDQKIVVRNIFAGFDFLKADVLRRLDELVNLRNNIFHFRPLNIYLVYGAVNDESSRYNIRKLLIQKMFFENPNMELMSGLVEIFQKVKVLWK